MDRRERGVGIVDAMLAMFEGQHSELWTAMPGIIQSFNAAKRTVVVQPAIQASVQAIDGSQSWVTLPLLLDCPVFFPGGGGITLTFPIKAGDECLVVFASRCIDNWWDQGGIQEQAELRMHDLSDGFAFVGVSSVPNVQAAISTTKAQLRNDAGTVLVEVDPAGILTLTATTVNINGTLNINGAPYLAHHHSGVTTGGGVSGGVV